MGSIGTEGGSYEVRQLVRRANEVTKPRHAAILMNDILKQAERANDSSFSYDEKYREEDKRILKNLIRKMKNKDYGPEE